MAPRDLAGARRLSEALRISPLTAQLLINRGLSEPASAGAFLRPELKALHDPSGFRQMPAAVDRLQRALRDGEGIGIFGDYDVDGLTGTAILAKFLRLLGREALLRVPHRATEGYGLSAAAVEAFAAAGIQVLVTVDCGTNSVAEIELARSRGMDVIVLDHHEAPRGPSRAFALLNPKAEEGYPFRGICSAGIAFKLAWALSTGLSRSPRVLPDFRAFLLDAMGFVALGTVADVSPLTDENRVFVTYGLDALRACRSVGIRALLEKAGCAGRALDSWDISFKLAPRLNALGRMGDARDGLDLLVADDPARVAEVMAHVESANRARKGIEDEVMEEAVRSLEAAGGPPPDPVIVAAGARWHIGVVGIVAARLVERYGRPAFVLAVSDGIAKGSARSVEGFPLHLAIEASRDLLVSGGGHAMAAGVAVREERLPEFRSRIWAFARSQAGVEAPEPVLDLDGEVELVDLSEAVVNEIARLGPHGEGNPPPRLAASGLRLSGEPRLMGRKNEHLSFVVSQNGGPTLRAVAFGRGALYEPLLGAREVSLAFQPLVNEWKGWRNVELRVEDVRFP